MKTLTISLLVFVMAAMPDTPQPFAKRPILGVYTFEDSSVAAFGLIDDQPLGNF